MVVCGGRYGLTPSDAISVDGQLFVGFGNDYFPGPTPRVQRLTRAVLGVGPPEPGPALVLSSASPNPTRGPWSLQFALRDHAEVTLDVFDVAGRRVLGQALGTFPPGPHVVSPDGGAALAPGVYQVRLRSGSHAAERVLVRMK